MRFKVGDKVTENRPSSDKKIGLILEAEADMRSSTGEFYLVQFPNGEGTQYTNGVFLQPYNPFPLPEEMAGRPSFIVKRRGKKHKY
jgi:hypothetical protein